MSAFFRRIFHHFQVGRVLALICRHRTMDTSALHCTVGEVGFVCPLSPRALGESHRDILNSFVSQRGGIEEK